MADKKFNSKLTKLKNSKTMQESFQVLLTFSELLSSEDVPEFIQRKLVLQVHYIKDFKCLVGGGGGSQGQKVLIKICFRNDHSDNLLFLWYLQPQ